MYKNIEFRTENGVAYISLNRPEVLNSFNREMGNEVQKAFSECKDNSEIRSVVLTGKGRAFCAGQDLKEAMPNSNPEDNDFGWIVDQVYNPIVRAIRHLPKPVISMVNGVAAGAGANMALSCDLCIASESASFIQSFSKIGLIPDSGGTWFLPRLIGMQRATAAMFLGEKIKAIEAKNLGMIYDTAPEDELEGKVRIMAETLSQQPTKAFAMMKEAINKSFVNTIDEQLDCERDLQSKAFRTNDFNEGVNAFLEKRKPNFKGN